MIHINVIISIQQFSCFDNSKMVIVFIKLIHQSV